MWHTPSSNQPFVQRCDGMLADCIQEGNKVYGPTTCMFVAQEVNLAARALPGRRGSCGGQ